MVGISEIKHHADCRELIRRFWPDHFREKDNCLCFVHGDSNESLQVSREFVYCHGCGFKADAVDLYQRGANLSKGDAIRELAREIGLGNGNGPPAGKDLQGRWAQLKRTPLSAEAISYLEQKRALPGMVDLLNKAGLIGFAPKTQRYEASIVFPLVSWQDQTLLGIQYVPISGGDKKFSKGTPAKEAFFLMDGRGGDFLVITEGIVNALSVLMACKTIRVGVAVILGSEFTEKLKNVPGSLDPVLFLDNDDAGRKATAKAIKILNGKCRVVDWSLAPEGVNDANDLLRAGHADVIERMVRHSKVLEAAPDLDGDRKNEELPGRRLIVIEECSAGRFLDTPPRPMNWHFEGGPGNLKLGSFGMVVADGGTGKGHISIQAALSTATSIPFLDGLYRVGVGAQGNAALFFGEEDEDVLHHRFYGICNSLVFGDPGGKLFLDKVREHVYVCSLLGVDARFTKLVAGEIGPHDTFTGLLKELTRLQDLKLIVFDPLARFFAGDEKDSAHATFFSTLMEKIAIETGATVLVSHHTTKSSQQVETAFEALTQHATRGASGLVNAARWQLTMAGVRQGEGRTLGISQAETWRYVAAQVTKSNNAARGGCFYLRRDDYGCLRLAQIQEARSEQDVEVTELILKKIAEEGCRYTRRGFCRVFSKEFHGYGVRRLERLIDLAINEGHLVTIESTNSRGVNVEFLSVSETYESG